MSAVDYMHRTIMDSSEPVTLIGTGSYTNIAMCLQQFPETAHNIESIVLMGGGIEPGPNALPQGRSGNVTNFSEFNIYNDPFAANDIFDSGTNVNLITTDATQRIHVDYNMQQSLYEITRFDVGYIVDGLVEPAARLDVPKFGTTGTYGYNETQGALGAFVHDPQVALYMKWPDLYKGAQAYAHAEEWPNETPESFELQRHGHLKVKWDLSGNVKVLNDVSSPQEVTKALLNSIRKFSEMVPG